MNRCFGCRAAALVLALCLTACSSSAASLPAQAPAASSSVSSLPSREHTLTVGYTPSDGFNPYLANSTLVMQNAGLLFEKLVEIGPDMELEYRVAESIECSGTSVVIHLRGGLCFADGAPLTPQDAASSLAAAKSSACYGARFANLTSIQVQNDALVLELAQPDSLFAYLCDIPVLKAEEISLAQPTASGRYTYGSGQDTLTRNSRDSLGGDGPGEIRLYPVEGYDEMMRALSMGELDLYTASDQSLGNASMTGQEIYYKTNNLIFLGFNAQRESPLLNTAQGRSLLGRLVNRRDLADKSYYGRAYPATGAINCYYSCVSSQQTLSAHADASGLEETLTALGYVYDSGRGYYQNAALADSSLELLVYSGNTYKKNTAVLLQKQFAEQGIEVRLAQTDDFNAYLAAVEAGEFDLYIGEVKLYNNMDLSPFWEGGALSSHLAQSEALTQSYEAFKSNKSAAGSFESALAAEAPFSPLLWRQGAVVTTRGLQGLESSLSNVYYSLQDLSFVS